MKHIASRENPLVKEIARLAHSARERRRSQIALLDGPHLIDAFLAAGGTPRIAVVSDSGLANAEVAKLFERCSAAAERAVLTDKVFASLSGLATPVGILACAPVPQSVALPAQLDDVVILDRIQDTGNVGSILRSAAAAGVRTVVGTVGTAFFWSPKVLRSGMGAQFALELHEHAPLADVLARCRGSVLATALDGKSALFEADLRGPVAWIFGNEGEGIAASVAARRMKIPMPGSAESLNVAAAAAVCLFEQVRQRRA